MAERLGECGFVKGDLICTRHKDHDGQHRGQPINRLIPFVNQ